MDHNASKSTQAGRGKRTRSYNRKALLPFIGKGLYERQIKGRKTQKNYLLLNGLLRGFDSPGRNKLETEMDQFIKKVASMRRMQNMYFATREQKYLIASREAEKQVDALLISMGERPSHNEPKKKDQQLSLL